MTAVRVIYDTLLDAYGPRGWWPIVRVPGQRPTYQPNSWREARTPREIFQIGVGAVLTQRCAWRNVADVIRDLATIGALDPAGIARITDEELAQRIRPCGTWRRKLATLRAWTVRRWVADQLHFLMCYNVQAVRLQRALVADQLHFLMCYNWP